VFNLTVFTVLGRGRGENKVSKKTEVRAEKGQRKKVILGWYRDRG
jgi:F0F1-type ATP synthase assembly protein I